MKKIVIIFILIANLCQGQLQNTWMLGHYLNPLLPKCGIDFNNGTADTFSLFRKMPFFMSNTMICDTVGNLLFYTNGIYIANQNHDTLLNSNNFNQGYGSTITSVGGLNMEQSAVILPLDDSLKKYIIVHFSWEQFQYNSLQYSRPINLKYSIIDINLDGGLGGIVQNSKGLVIINDTLIAGKLSACRHANGRDWWLLTHKLESSIFYKLLITPDTLISSTQSIGINPYYNSIGQAVFSPDGSKYALLTTDHLIQLFDFDRCDGSLSNHKILYTTDTMSAYIGCSFSTNGQYLYTNTQLNIFQYDLWSTNIDSSLQTVATWDSVVSPFPTLFCNQQLGPDGKIYLGTWNGCNVLHCITNPDAAGIACNILQNNINLPARNNWIPNYPNYGLGALTGSPCDTLTGVNNTNTNTTQLNLFPNPATNYVNITYQFKTNEQALFTLYNSMGQEVVRKTLYGTFKSLLLHTNTYNAGMYYYKVVMKNKMVQTGKLVIGR